MLGDSITNSDRETSFDYYPRIIEEWLGDDYLVIERGCGGTTSLQWIPTASEEGIVGTCNGYLWFLYDTFAYPNTPAEIATVLLGTNDAIQGDYPTLTPAEYRANIEDITLQLLEDDVDTVILMTPPMLPDAIPLAGRIAVSNYRNQVLDLCSSIENVVCGPDLFALLNKTTHFPLLEGSEDERDLHPNAAGHLVIAHHLFNTIVSLPEATQEAVIAVPEPDIAWMQGFGFLGVLGLQCFRSRRASA
jgi:lysophospholipase L1-like esterase